MRTSAPAGAPRSASPTVEKGLPGDPSAGAADVRSGPGGATKSTAGAISRGLGVWAHHGGVASQAATRGRTKDQSLTGRSMVPARRAHQPAIAQGGLLAAKRVHHRAYVLRGRRPTWKSLLELGRELRSGSALPAGREGRSADRGARLSGPVPPEQLVDGDAAQLGGAPDHLPGAEEMEPVAHERGHHHALARGRVRSHRLEVVDEPRQRLCREPLPGSLRIDHQLVRPRERERCFHIAGRPRGGGSRGGGLLARLGDGAVGFRRRQAPIGDFQKARETIVHVRKVTASGRKRYRCVFHWRQRESSRVRVVWLRGYHCEPCVRELDRLASVQRLVLTGSVRMDRVRELLFEKRDELQDRWDRQLRAAAEAGFPLDHATSHLLPPLLDAAGDALEKRFRLPVAGTPAPTAGGRRAAVQGSLLADFLFDAVLEHDPSLSAEN